MDRRPTDLPWGRTPNAPRADYGDRSGDRSPNMPDRGPQTGTIDRRPTDLPWGKTPNAPRADYGDRSGDRSPNLPDRGPQTGTIDRTPTDLPWGKTPNAPRADYGDQSSRQQERSQWYGGQHSAGAPPAYGGWQFGQDRQAPTSTVPSAPSSPTLQPSWFGGRDWGTNIPHSTPDVSSPAPVVRPQPSQPTFDQSPSPQRRDNGGPSFGSPSPSTPTPSPSPSAPSSPRSGGFGRHH